MLWLVIVACGVAAIYAMHRLALWMETKGWIYYMHKKASPDTLGNATLGVQQIIQPGAKHVLEVRRNKRIQRDDAGDPEK